MNKPLRVPFLICLLVFVFPLIGIPTFGNAQTTTASLQGTVRDTSGARIPGAIVTIANTETGLKQSVTSDATGFFSFPRLAVGNYDLRAIKSGFRNYLRTGVLLAVGQAANAPITLKVGSAVNTVTVTAGIPLVNTQTPTSNYIVHSRQARDLPLNGRNTQDLVNIAPGTVNNTRYGSPIRYQGALYPDEAVYSIDGADPDSVNYQMDGISHNDSYLNASLPFPNPDAIQEFGIQSSNFSAEYGNAAGGIVNIVTKSGTNHFHGDAFEFLRNGSLNAKNYFGTTHDSLHRNQFGASVGGPILRNRFFFFGSFQKTPTSSASNANVTFVPTAAERTGDFSAVQKQLYNPFTNQPLTGNQIPTADLNPVALALLKYIPLPNAGSSNGELTYSGLPLRTDDLQALGRLDYTYGKNQLSGHYFFSRYSQPATLPKTNILTANGGNNVTVQTVAVSDTYAPSATLLFNTIFGWDSQTGGSTSAAPFSWADLGSKIAHGNPPELGLNITSGFSISTNHQGTFDRGDFTIREDVTKIIGKHELHFGGQLEHVYNNLVNTYLQSGSWNFSGQLSGNGLADFMFGSASQLTQGGGQYSNVAGVLWALFAQDDWRATNRLTLDLGLRWDPWIPWYDRKGRNTCWVPGGGTSKRFPNAPAGLLYGGDPGCPTAGTLPTWPEFGPRIGFGYRLSQNGKNSVRGGFGIYYTPIPTVDHNSMSTSAPFSPRFHLYDVDFTNPYQSAGIPNPFPAQYGSTLPDSSIAFTLPVGIGGVYGKHFQPGRTESYNLIVEHQMGRSSVLRIAYLGSHSSHLTYDVNGQGRGNTGVQRQLNAAVYVPGNSTEANIQSRRPYSDFSYISENTSTAIANYNALQASFETRMKSGNTINASYTWSKSLDDLVWDDPYNQMFSYGPSGWSVPNNFKFSDVWNLPAIQSRQDLLTKITNGWQLNSIVLWQSGFPNTVYSGVDNSFSGVGGDHADYLGGAITLPGNRSHRAMAKEWFNTAAFGPNAVGTFGTASKGQVYSPSEFNADMALVKDTQIRDNLNLQLRFEAFNAFNNVNFGPPQTTQSSSSFGQITTALAPRILQLAAKIQF